MYRSRNISGGSGVMTLVSPRAFSGSYYPFYFLYHSWVNSESTRGSRYASRLSRRTKAQLTLPNCDDENHVWGASQSLPNQSLTRKKSLKRKKWCYAGLFVISQPGRVLLFPIERAWKQQVELDALPKFRTPWINHACLFFRGALLSRVYVPTSAAWGEHRLYSLLHRHISSLLPQHGFQTIQWSHATCSSSAKCDGRT